MRRKNWSMEDRDKVIARQERLLGNEMINAVRTKLETMNDTEIDRLLRESNSPKSNSVSALPGGRPESNRRKF